MLCTCAVAVKIIGYRESCHVFAMSIKLVGIKLGGPLMRNNYLAVLKQRAAILHKITND